MAEPFTPTPPPEIWLKIFRHATEDPSSSLERFQLGPNYEYHYWKETSGYRDALATKLALVATCRHWNRLATPLLYEHVSICNTRQYKLFLRALTRGKKSRASESRAAWFSTEDLRHFVSRLDLYCSDPDRALGMTVRLCAPLKELRILVASLGPSDNDQPSTLFNALPPRLQHLFWLRHKIERYNLGQTISYSSVVSLLNDHLELETVSIPFMINCDAITPSHIQAWKNLSWPSIRTLVFQHYSQVTAASLLPKDAFPGLHYVNATFHFSETSPCLITFLSTHGSEVSVLSLNPGAHDMRPPEHQLLRHLASGSPIQEVHLWFPDFRRIDWLDYVPGRPASVTTVAFHVAPATSGERSCSEITGMHTLVASPWTKIFSNLRTIRIMEPVDVDFYKRHNYLSRKLMVAPARWARNPIHVEDISGHALAGFSAGVSAVVWESRTPVPRCCVPTNGRSNGADRPSSHLDG